MEEGEHVVAHVLRSERHNIAIDDREGDLKLVIEHYPLGRAGGTGGEHNAGKIFG